jgi:ABC-type glycerol-3-phosphate transport system substrate-binding protein
MSLANRLFFTSGDSVLVNRNATSAMLFNKKLLADLGLGSPYEFVRNGQWTIPKFYEMARAAVSDLDGGGQMTWDAGRFGFLGQPSLAFPMLIGAGVRIVDKDENDLPIWIFESDRTFTAADAIYDLVHSGVAWGVDNYRAASDAGGGVRFAGASAVERSFAENRGLFMVTEIMAVETFRRMETDFGILPIIL